MKHRKYILQEETKEVYVYVKGDKYLFLGSFDYFGIRRGDSRQKRIGRVKSLEEMPRFPYVFSREKIEDM